MKQIVEFFLENRLIVILLTVIILVAGIISTASLRRESYPQVNLDLVKIVTIYPGGAPDELESLISIPMEDKLREVSGIDKLRSYNIENVSFVAAILDEIGRAHV